MTDKQDIIKEYNRVLSNLSNAIGSSGSSKELNIRPCTNDLQSLQKLLNNVEQFYPESGELVFHGTQIGFPHIQVKNAIVSKWYKNVGDTVEAGETIVSIQIPNGFLHVSYRKKAVVTKRLKEEGDVLSSHEVLAMMSNIPDELYELDGFKFLSQEDIDDYKKIKQGLQTLGNSKDHQFTEEELKEWVKKEESLQKVMESFGKSTGAPIIHKIKIRKYHEF